MSYTITSLAIAMQNDPAGAAETLRRAFKAAGTAPGASDRVAAQLGIARRSVYRYVAQLEQAGHLKPGLLPGQPGGRKRRRPQKPRE